MRVYALSDLHLSFQSDKPMNVFGERWDNYEEKIRANWNEIVTSEDIVVIAGDISWAMQIENTKKDFEYIDSLNGKKVIVRGNHDFWWKTISKVREIVPSSISVLQNDAIKVGNLIFCGTRGWLVPERGKPLGEQDQKIYDRELIRLEMALVSANKLKENEDNKIIVVLHYPPFNSDIDENEFTALLEKYNIKIVIYGHLHGKTKYKCNNQEKNGIKYYLSSCDKVNFSPILILDND